MLIKKMSNLKLIILNLKLRNREYVLYPFYKYKKDKIIMIENLESKRNKLEGKELINIEKLFLNSTNKYEKMNIDWDNEVGKEIWYNDESEESK